MQKETEEDDKAEKKKQNNEMMTTVNKSVAPTVGDRGSRSSGSDRGKGDSYLSVGLEQLQTLLGKTPTLGGQSGERKERRGRSRSTRRRRESRSRSRSMSVSTQRSRKLSRSGSTLVDEHPDWLREIHESSSKRDRGARLSKQKTQATIGHE